MERQPRLLSSDIGEACGQHRGEDRPRKDETMLAFCRHLEDTLANSRAFKLYVVASLPPLGRVARAESDQCHHRTPLGHVVYGRYVFLEGFSRDKSQAGGIQSRSPVASWPANTSSLQLQPLNFPRPEFSVHASSLIAAFQYALQTELPKQALEMDICKKLPQVLHPPLSPPFPPPCASISLVPFLAKQASADFPASGSRDCCDSTDCSTSLA
nr:hypothetical protein Iba_chr05fCG13990 [Ipomoea batatas]